MLPSQSQMQTRSGIVNNTAQSFSLYASSTGSNQIVSNNIYNAPISRIPKIGSTFSQKLDSVFRVFYENVNGLSTNRKS